MSVDTEKWNKALGLMQRMDEAEGKHLNFVEYGNNTKPLVPLNESDVAKLLDRHTDGYIIVSACRSEENIKSDKTDKIKKKIADIQKRMSEGESGLEEKLEKLINLLEYTTREVNNERSRELRVMTNNAGFSYKQVYGGYHELNTENFQYEQSLIIFPKGKGDKMHTFEELDNFGLEMCRKYDQDTYLRVMPNGVAQYVKQDGSIDGTFENGKVYNDFTQEFFSDLHKNSDKYKDGDINAPARPTRFTLTEVYVNPRPCSYQEGHMRWHNGERADWPAK